LPGGRDLRGRAKAVALVRELGINEASRRTGHDGKTLRKWCQEAGVDTSVTGGGAGAGAEGWSSAARRSRWSWGEVSQDPEAPRHVVTGQRKRPPGPGQRGAGRRE
jgi:hypothetical protein